MRIVWVYTNHTEDHSMRIVLVHTNHTEDHSMRIVWVHTNHTEDHSMRIVWVHTNHTEDHSMRIVWVHTNHTEDHSMRIVWVHTNHTEDHSMRIVWVHTNHTEDHSMRIVWVHTNHTEDHSMRIVWVHTELILITMWGSQYKDRVMWCHCDHRMISRVDWVRTGNGFWGICLLIVNRAWRGNLSGIYLVIRCFSYVHSSTLLSLYVNQKKSDVWTEAVLLLSMLYVCIWQSPTAWIYMYFEKRSVRNVN